MKRKSGTPIRVALLLVVLSVAASNAWAVLVYEGSGPHIVPAGSNGNMYASLDSSVFMQDETSIISTAYVFETSQFNITDGQVSKINSYDDAVINISGGNVAQLIAACDSTVNIYGVFDAYGPIEGIFGDITGVIGGQLRTIGYIRDEQANIVLHELGIPEPASILALGLGSLWIRKKRQS